MNLKELQDAFLRERTVPLRRAAEALTPFINRERADLKLIKQLIEVCEQNDSIHPILIKARKRLAP